MAHPSDTFLVFECKISATATAASAPSNVKWSTLTTAPNDLAAATTPATAVYLDLRHNKDKTMEILYGDYHVGPINYPILKTTATMTNWDSP